MTLVLDASVVLAEAALWNAFERFGGQELVAPPMMWSEAWSSVHEAVRRGEVSADVGRRLVEVVDAAPVRPKGPRGLRPEAWRIADELGWAKTSDAEYVALASLLGCRLVTLDARLRRGADRLGIVVSPTEL